MVTYPWDVERMEPDIDAAAKMIRDEKPQMCLFGQSVFLFPTPLEELSEVAHEVGAKVMYDGAHVLGLIAGGQFQDPLREGADMMTGSSHKTFPGPQHGIILGGEDVELPSGRGLHRTCAAECSPAYIPTTICIRWQHSE